MHGAGLTACGSLGYCPPLCCCLHRRIIAQAVKEVLQSLVDDDLVHSERIGISNYFWWGCFE